MCETKRPNPFFRLHEACDVLHKYVIAVWSDNFTVAFFVSFNVTVSNSDVEAQLFPPEMLTGGPQW